MPGDTCSNCGTGLPPESPGSSRADCAICGASARTISLSAAVSATSSVGASLTVIPYQQALFALAKELHASGQHGLDVVVAHIACEVAILRAFDRAFVTKGLQYLQGPIMKFSSGYNLDNSRLRRLYTALTGDDIASKPFWPAFSASAERRNRMVHEGTKPSPQEASESLNAVDEFLAHVG